MVLEKKTIIFNRVSPPNIHNSQISEEVISKLKVRIHELEEELMKEREVSRSEREANIVYNNTFEDIKKAIFQKKNKEYELKIYEIVEELESIFHETKEGSVNLKNEKN